MMEPVRILCQLVIALGIFNVWLLRFGSPSAWRGGSAKNMKEEFAAYGLPGWAVWGVGITKVSLAVLLVAGIWAPALTQPAAIAMAVLMVAAITLHFKVQDPVKKSLPALSLLALSLVVALL